MRAGERGECKRAVGREPGEESNKKMKTLNHLGESKREGNLMILLPNAQRAIVRALSLLTSSALADLSLSLSLFVLRQ